VSELIQRMTVNHS